MARPQLRVESVRSCMRHFGSRSNSDRGQIKIIHINYCITVSRSRATEISSRYSLALFANTARADSRSGIRPPPDQSPRADLPGFLFWASRAQRYVAVRSFPKIVSMDNARPITLPCRKCLRRTSSFKTFSGLNNEIAMIGLLLPPSSVGDGIRRLYLDRRRSSTRYRQAAVAPSYPVHASLYRIGIDGVGIRHVGACPGALRHARNFDMADIQRNHDCRFGAVAVFLSHSSKGCRSQGAIAASIL